MTKTVRIHKTGGPEVLRIEDLPVGNPGPGEIRIRVQTIGLNRSEAVYRAGQYLVAPKLPSLMGYEAFGTVEALGPGVQGHAPGDRVCVIPAYRLGEYGVYAESAIVPARCVVAAPAGLTPVQACAVWMAFLTAYAIIEVAKVGIGDYVLIPAASSSVGLAAIQLANWAGAVPIALTRHGTKAAALREQGAQHVVATEETDMVAEVMRITGGKGARTAFDPVGGPFVEKLCGALAEEGILFIYGGLSGAAHALSSLARGAEGPEHPRLGVLVDYQQAGTLSAGARHHSGGPRFRAPEAGHREDFHAGSDRRRARLPRIQSADRQDRGHRLVQARR